MDKNELTDKFKEAVDKAKEVIREDSSRVFSTGARRNSAEGKGRYDQIPVEAVKAMALRFEYGAKLHGEGNYRLGVPNKSLFDSALRHLFQALNGETDEDHLGACMCNVAMLIYNKENGLGEE